MSRRLVATMVLAGLLVLTSSTALAERLEFDTDRENPRTESACGAEVLDMALSADELSANERIMADAWRSHLHARKAAALEGVD